MSDRLHHEDQSSPISRALTAVFAVIILFAAIMYGMFYNVPIKDHYVIPATKTEVVYICLENLPSLDPDRIKIVCVKWVKEMESIQELTNQYPLYGWITLPQESKDILLPK